MSAVQKMEPRQDLAVSTLPVTPMEMLASAIDKGMSMETIDRLVGFAERLDKINQRKSFDAAVSAAKAEIPVILKTATGHNNKKYADFATIARTIDPILGKHGLGYRFRTIQDEKTIHTACILFHRDGHAEENTLIAAADATGSKNAIQAIGSTLTYLQRYSLVQALGLAASEDDDGKATVAGEKISDEQASKLLNLIDTKVVGTEGRLLKWARVERIEDLPAARYAEALEKLKSVQAAS